MSCIKLEDFKYWEDLEEWMNKLSPKELEDWLKSLTVGELLEIHYQQAREINRIRDIVLNSIKKVQEKKEGLTVFFK